MNYLGDFEEDADVVVPFATTVNGVPTAPSSAFETADYEIVKNGTTSKSTANGLTAAALGGLTGAHVLTIDTSVDTGDSGFWATGNEYEVLLDPDETLNGAAVGGVIATFSIENRYMRGTDSGATAAALATVDAILDAVLADTNELQGNQGAWVTATGFATAAALATVDSNVDAVKAKTDQLIFTSGALDARVARIGSAAVTGDGAGTPWGPA